MAEQDYVDFSDMGNTELPAEIEDQGAPKENLSIGFAENTDINQGETPPEETKEVEPEVETPPKEDPSQNPYWQSKYDKEVVTAKQEAEKLRQEIESIKGQLNPPKKEEPLTAPTPPRKNADTGQVDPIDEIQYARELSEYNRKLSEKENAELKGELNTIKGYFESIEQQKKQDQERAYYVGEFVKAGADPQEATQVLARMTQAYDNPQDYFKALLEFDRFKNGNQSKPSKVEQRANRKFELPPLGAETSEDGTQKVDPDDKFYTDMQGFIKGNY